MEGIPGTEYFTEGFFGGSMVKNPPAVQETQVWSLGGKDPLEKEMATYSSILAWEIPWTEEPGRLQSMGSQRVGHDWATSRKVMITLYQIKSICLHDSLKMNKEYKACIIKYHRNSS